VSETGDWVQVAALGGHACGIRASGGARRLYCWGDNSFGQLGTGSLAPEEGFSEVDGRRTDWAQVAPGTLHTCAVTQGGELYCWGRNVEGQLGFAPAGGETLSPRPLDRGGPLALGWLSVAAGEAHTCAVRRDPDDATARLLYCWGSNESAQQGTSSGGSLLPPRVVPIADVADVRSGPRHACAITTAGLLLCWGANTHQEAGPSASTPATPSAIGSDSDWTQIAANGGCCGGGSPHTCGVRGDGVLECFGSNSRGQLGRSTSELLLSGFPLEVDAAMRFRAVATGAESTCGVRTDGSLFCWGTNGFGQIGLGDTAPRTAPYRVCF
jgi:alpha-tubulin suppressor-like RCC1 family protein